MILNTTDKEAYVSLKVAEMLKKKGFNWKCITVYITTEERPVPHILDTLLDYNSGEVKYCISCPTQQMACRWLREEKGINIIPFHERLPNDCYWCRIEHRLLTAHQQSPIYSSYEDAVEAALKYCLTNLI